jgi:glycosyltransferase involved in cell wall biosynthesis
MISNHIEYTISNNIDTLDDSYNLVLCINKFFPPDSFPKTCKVIYGPQFFVFPDNPDHEIFKYEYEQNRFYFNTLSSWNKEVHKEFIPLKMKLITCPFGIDIDNIPIRKIPVGNKVMIYFKRRHTSLLDHIISYLHFKGIDYSIFSYGSYNDADYKAEMDNCKFIIWIGTHESQGFAFQEALARNIPILLWDVNTMYEEYINNYPIYNNLRSQNKKLIATVANVWSDECGVKFTDGSEFESKFIEMNQKYDAGLFNPRKVIANELSLDKAYKNMLEQVGLN